MGYLGVKLLTYGVCVGHVAIFAYVLLCKRGLLAVRK